MVRTGCGLLEAERGWKGLKEKEEEEEEDSHPMLNGSALLSLLTPPPAKFCALDAAERSIRILRIPSRDRRAREESISGGDCLVVPFRELAFLLTLFKK